MSYCIYFLRHFVIIVLLAFDLTNLIKINKFKKNRNYVLQQFRQNF